jgi:NAD(P)H-hydrate epimerase
MLFASLWHGYDPPASKWSKIERRKTMNDSVVLTIDEMYKADAAAMSGGVPGIDLMEAAGAAVAREIRHRWKPRPLAVLCGPGNNGGDGFVVARLLDALGWPVRLALLGSPEKLKGDAATNAQRWKGPVLSLDDSFMLADNPLVVDALFGAGLQRPIEGIPAQIIEVINTRGMDCVAVDVPSGVHGDTGKVMGMAPLCVSTVTFFRPKPGHCLLPGRELCGKLVVADIGIPETVLANIASRTFINGLNLWLDRFPWPTAGGNKYSRGHGVIVGGDRMTGAARLAADSARRMGAGLVTIAAHSDAFTVYASGSPGNLFSPISDITELEALIADPRRNAFLIGPGAGVSEETRLRVLSLLGTGKPCVLDADAMTVFRDDSHTLFDTISGPCLLTPHEGEFTRIFSVQGDKLASAREAARTSGATILLKGADTVIATADGCAVINASAPPELATAGSGDVLAGMALGLLAQGMTAFDAACAATWLHGDVATAFGPGLIAEDLINGLPAALKRLKYVI